MNKLSFVAIIFFALYIILPSYFAIELASFLPLMTGSRIILILLIISYIFKQKGIINVKIFYNKNLKKYFKIYFLCVLITNLYYCAITTEAIKRILVIIIEELLLLWIVVKVINTKEKLIFALKIISIMSGITAVIAVIGSITDKNLFNYLNTVSRDVLIANYYRLGFLRAEAGFGHAVYYGLYCVVIIPIAMYLAENEKRNLKYIICLSLNILGLIFSNSRGPFLVLGVLVIYMIFNKKKELLKKYIPFIICCIYILLILFFINQEFKKFIGNIIISLTNVFASETVAIENYGLNDQNGVDSRMSQFTMVTYALSRNPLFGLGAGAHTRGVQMWFNPSTNRWNTIKTYDVGYFSIICMYGIIGFIGNIILFWGIIKNVLKNKLKDDQIILMFKYVFIGYFLGLFAVTGINNVFWMLLSLLVSYLNILENANNEEENIILRKRVY